MNRSGPAQILIASLAFALSMVLPAGAEIPEAAAKEYAKKGALVVDVRTVEEFNARRLTNAINIPVADVKVKFPKVVTNKNDVVLLHCRSGRAVGLPRPSFARWATPMCSTSAHTSAPKKS